MANEILTNQGPALDNQEQTQTSPPKKKPSSHKKLKIAGVVFGVLLLVFIAIGASSSVVPKYKVSDLVPVTQSKIEFSRPVQWEDASYASNLIKDFGLEVSDASIFGDKIVKDSNGKYDIENAAVIFGLASKETTDVSILKSPEFKAEFEKAMNNQLKEDSFKTGTCQTISNYGKNYNYDYNNIPVSIAIKLNCGLSDENKKKFNADSVEMRIAILMANDGKTYMYALIASDKSWAKNEQVYYKMMEDLKGL